MSRFKKKKGNKLPGISTSSLPDIVFMLLFFFMVTTKMKEVTLKVVVRKPDATQASKLENKSLISNIYIGKPISRYQSQYGDQPLLQLDDAFAKPNDVGPWVLQEIDKTAEFERNKRTVSLKVDRDVKMGVVTDVKEQLREVNALKINYSARKAAILD
ncbi:MAG: biopolymer transporter ExbD [Candidatus Competibacteraceae bacterium]|nr:biopolymer transporter ExbD [Candidatus Competibacteraceae bacterium]